LGILAISARFRLTHRGQLLQKAARRFYRGEQMTRNAGFFASISRWPSLLSGGFAALMIFSLPFALQAYLPPQLRFNLAPPTVIISSPPASPASPAPVNPPAVPATPRPTSQGTTLTAQDIRTLIDVWRSVIGQMNAITNVTNAGDALIPVWPENVKADPGQLSQQLIGLRDTINQRRVSLQTLDTNYRRFPNVESTLNEVIKDDTIGRLYRALDSFATEVRGVTKPPPENFEETLRPYAGELKGALNSMALSASQTRTFANRQIDELSNIKIK
jgi:hypothetical protein